jgi:Uma2 family endonuclease
MELTEFLVDARRAGYGYFFSDTTAVALDYPVRGDDSIYVSHPDLFFIRQEREQIIGDRAIEGAPDLIVETLSLNTLDKHARGGRPSDAYERHDVPHSWIVDNDRRTIALHALAGAPYQAGRYGPATLLRPGDMLTCALFPALSLPVTRLSCNVRDRRRGRYSDGRCRPPRYPAATEQRSAPHGPQRLSIGRGRRAGCGRLGSPGLPRTLGRLDRRAG